MRRFAAAYPVFASLILYAAPLQADLQTGQRVADQLRQGTAIPDRLVELDAGGSEFIAIHRAGQRDPRRGAVVLLHDHLTNADSPEAIRPLRLGLATAGWDTLSLQLGVAARASAPGPDTGASDSSAARLEAGLDWLRARGITNLVILAQGSRGQVVLEWISGARPQDVRALILLSSTLALAPEAAELDRWRDLGLPLLDLVAERDYAPVAAAAPGRRAALGASGRPGYRQQTLAGTEAGFFGAQAALVGRVRAWLSAILD